MKRYCSRQWFVFCLATLGFAAPSFSQSYDTNPFTSAADVAEGRRLYRFNCVNCHGMDGASGRGAKLASTFRRYGSSDREMFQTIYKGIPETEMPGLWLDEESVWKILAFVRTLEANATKGCGVEQGDSRRGRKIFIERGGCISCHTVGPTGGRLGPDLTHIGATRTDEQLRSALVKPNKDVPERYRAVKVTTRTGEDYEGVLMNEDGYTLIMMDRQEGIHSFLKEEVQEVERPSESLMPAYGQSLRSADADDLLAYLCTLGRP